MILVIDDDPAIREFVSYVLQGLGYEVVQAADAESGFHLFRLVQPQLIITDIVLPNLDGFHYIHQVRKLDKTVPIIAMTSNVHGHARDYLAQCRLMGANDVMQKPLTINRVKEVVLKLLPPGRKLSLEDIG